MKETICGINSRLVSTQAHCLQEAFVWMVFHHVIKAAMLVYKNNTKLWLMFCITIESNSQDFFHFCSVHQHGVDGVE